MSPTLSAAPSRPGLYGKLHTHGDFISRRLSQQFIGPWDLWLQDGIAESRNVLEAAWEDIYKEAPVWRFLLAPGVCGDDAWAGIVQPSVDRVGRFFPLTIAAALPGDVDGLAAFFAAAPWYAAVEREAAAAFEDSPNLDTMDAALEQLMFPAECLAPAAGSDEDTLPIAKRVFSVMKVTLEGNRSLDAARAALAAEQVTVGPWDCLWVNSATNRMAPVLLVTKALPDKRHFCAFLNGRWEAHGWESDSRVADPSE